MPWKMPAGAMEKTGRVGECVEGQRMVEQGLIILDGPTCKYKQSQVVNMRKKFKVVGSLNDYGKWETADPPHGGRGAAVSKHLLLDAVCVCVGGGGIQDCQVFFCKTI